MEWLPKLMGPQVLIISWVLCTIVFTTSYSGILTAMLTIPKITIPVDSLEDLVNQDKIPWKLEVGSSMYQYFQVMCSN